MVRRCPELEKALKGFMLGKAIEKGPLTVIPLVFEGGEEPGKDCMSMEEALEKGVLEITEKGGGMVPVLEARSRAETEILLPLGGVVTGGKQNRMIARDIVLKPREKRTIPVFCVEAGRWDRPRRKMNFFETNIHGSSRMKASLVRGTNQGEIWDKVASTMISVDAGSPTSDFTAGLSSSKVEKTREELSRVEEEVLRVRGARGGVVLVDGKVRSVELFGSTSYFKNVWPRLFSSFLLEVAEERPGEETGEEDPLEAARDFFRKMEDARVLVEKGKGEISRAKYHPYISTLAR